MDVTCHDAGIAHLLGSLKAEPACQTARVGVHCLSPGMVLTNLLLEGASDTNKQVCYLAAIYLSARVSPVPCQGPLQPKSSSRPGHYFTCKCLQCLVKRVVACLFLSLVQEQTAPRR